MTLENRYNVLLSLALVGVGVGIGYLLWGRTPKIVSVPHNTVQTVEGVKQASSTADVYLKDEQATEISKAVQHTQKEYTIETTINKLPKTAETERKKNGADFSLITDPNNPDKSFDLSKYDSKIPVELNQYNITAYKKRLYGVNYYPESISNWNPAMVSVDYSIRISRSGKYLGASAAYNLDNDKAYLGIRYEF